MEREEKVTLTNMCMVCDGKGNMLVQDKIHPEWPGLTFPGGHVEPGESITGSVIREVFEETGLRIEHPRLCGIKQFEKDSGARYIVFLYKAERFTGELHSSEEGEVFWVARSELDKYVWGLDFVDVLKVFESDELSEFYYYKDSGEWKMKLL